MANAKYEDNIDLLAGMSLLDLADMPERPVLPTGTYQGEFVDMVAKSKEEDGELKVMVGLKLQVIAPLELANPEEASDLENLKEGAEIEYNFFLNSEYGQGSLKRVLKGLVEELGIEAGSGFDAIREAMQGKPICFEVSRRPAKKPTDTIKWDVNLLAVTTASPTEVAEA